MAEEKTVAFERPLKWTGIDETPIYFTNQMLIQHQQNEFVLTFGHVTSPPFLKPPTQKELAAIKFVPVTPIVRLGLTPQRLL